MTIKYVGPRPLISVSGIDFDHKKEDKYIYLSIVAELIQALDHEYVKDQHYVAMTGKKPLDPATILSLIRSYDSELDEAIAERNALSETEIDDELTRAHENRLINDEERHVLIKNIELMRPYRIQRSINKTVYYSGIATLAHIIKKGHIDYITAPMFPIFMHVFHSIQGVLGKFHPPLDSEIDIFEENSHLSVRLKLKNL